MDLRIWVRFREMESKTCLDWRGVLIVDEFSRKV